MFDLSGRVALVTGGNGGIGLGLARERAPAGSLSARASLTLSSVAGSNFSACSPPSSCSFWAVVGTRRRSRRAAEAP